MFSLAYAPLIDDPERARLHAVDAPVAVSDLIADRGGEAAKVGANHVDEGALVADHAQPGALAAVLGPAVGAGRGGGGGGSAGVAARAGVERRRGEAARVATKGCN